MPYLRYLCPACGHEKAWERSNGLFECAGYGRKTAEVGENLLPLCHREASLIKRWLVGAHQGAASHEHLAYYLDEYTFRFSSVPHER